MLLGVRVTILASIVAVGMAIGRPSPAPAAAILFVDPAAGGSADGSSWDNAFTDLQSGLAAATAGDQVWVAASVYLPTTGSSRTASFELKTGVAIYGGFAGGESSLAQRDITANTTVVDGDIGADGVATDNSYHVVTAGPVDVSAVLDGFTVRGGYANGAAALGTGGGGYIASGSPTLRNLTFSANFAADGGGLYNDSGSPQLTNVSFRANSASSGGGGFANAGGAAELSQVIFSANSAQLGGGFSNLAGAAALTDVTFTANLGESGGGFYNEDASPSLARVTFSSNRASSGGGGLYSHSGDPSLVNVTFYGNTSGNMYGGGVYVDVGSPTLTHTTFVRNRASSHGGGLWNYQGTPTIRESIFWDNEPLQIYEDPNAPNATFGHNVIEGGCPTDVTCVPSATIISDPLLGPLAQNAGLTRTVALQPGSSAIDAGTPAICETVTTDQRGVSRPRDGNKDGTSACDLGAFEFAPPAPVVSFIAPKSSGSESDTSATIAVKLSTTAVGPVTVNFKVANGTGKSPGDYVASSGTLTFPALSTTRNVTFTVVNDRFDERSETVVITLSAPAGATLGSATHTYTITDDDPRVTCRGRLPTIIGTDRNDTLTGTRGPDVIVGLAGNDRITGNGGDDLICAGPGNDTASGGTGNDVVRGDAGTDRLTGDLGSDQLNGGGGADRLGGGASANDGCAGGPGPDALLPNHGCESLSGVP